MISSVRPEKTTAAAITLYRHLVNRPEISLKILPAEDYEISRGSVRSKIIYRLSRPPFSRLGTVASLLLHTLLPVGRSLPCPTTSAENTLVLTLAAYNGCWVAQRYARKHGLPLVVRFDDWWPDRGDMYLWLRRYLNNKFVSLYNSATVSICVCDGMRQRLGPHPNSRVVFPMPEERKAPVVIKERKGGLFRVCYLGNMFDYGPMLARLAERVIEQSRVRIEFRGPEPLWPRSLKQRMREKGLLHDFGAGLDFDSWFEGFDAYLVAMFFESEQRRRVETCFATKLTGYSALGRPIVIWAPETSSVVQWARLTNGALCVTDPNPVVLIEALSSLAEDAAEQIRLGTAARLAYESEFNPEYLQLQFMEALVSAFAVRRSETTKSLLRPEAA